MGKLSAVAVKAALANPGTYQDGEGLFLKVDKRGGAYWLLRLQRDGKRQDIGLGSAKLLMLAEARQKASGLRKAVKIDRRDVLAENKVRSRRNGDFPVCSAPVPHRERGRLEKLRLCPPVARQSGKLRLPEIGRRPDWKYHDC